MGLKVVIEPLRQISSDIWEGIISSEDLELFNKPEFHEGDVSILLVKNPLRVGEERLEFKPEYARVLNAGNSGKILVIGMFGDSHKGGDNTPAERDPNPVVKEW